MTIILFLVDTSASMNQRTYLGTAFIDVAKAAVETFMKIRSRDPNSRWDRYMLLTYEDPPLNVKAGWKESHATFVSELRHLKAGGLSTLGSSLKHAFDLLNINRMQTGIDTYGQGRCPFYLEPAVIIVITDNSPLTSTSSVQPQLNLPMDSTVPGSELTKEPFRWDQRIFSIVLRMSGSIPSDIGSFPFIPSAETHPIDVMCDVTGGRSYAIFNQKMLNSSLESLVQKVQTGVVINFEKFGPDPPSINDRNDSDANGNLKAPWHTCRKLIYVPRSAQKGYSVGHWPIPEAFWPDATNPNLPPRTAHPNVRFSCTLSDPMVIDNLPFDKYELEPSPLTQYILERRQPNTCWQVHVSNSAKFNDLYHPFGYIKASSALTTVNLFVMPYNYPILLPLLDDLFKIHKLKPTPKWRQQFDNYLKTMPGYYAGPLRRALARMGAPNLVPDQMDNCLSYSVITYLKKLKNQAKVEMDRLLASVGQKIPVHEGIKVSSRTKTSFLKRKDFNELVENLGAVPSIKQELQDYNTFTIGVPVKDIQPQYYRNPYDIPRKNLLDQVKRMRTNFLQTSYNNTKLVDEDQQHSIPVQQMGNYQEYLRKQPPPLRELENTPARLHTFGNPFKVKSNEMKIDEADEAAVFGTSNNNQPKLKRSVSESPPSSPGPRKRKPDDRPLEIVLDSSDDEVNEQTKTMNKVNSVNHVMDYDTSIVNNMKPNANIDMNNKKELGIWLYNNKLKYVCFKEVKKPGRRYEQLFSLMNTVRGSIEVRCAFVKEIIHEANRFKKKTLVQMLEQFEQSMIKVEKAGGVR
ncbi:hypothetical protein LOTGIDRAFT_179396 [Lottia gigantea]|uniref:VWFA domain-containing protein n=1 Tax=Lottia gigantea TaxID=225164 RepID=V3ZV27_LOTGI|nr:hypothetical protein LOTGIDRAFT_179396 [Lottia gigantea]ESO86410.1 hypothetical protein LOTGIDRAFT_179396 [Lottia gigantea]